MGQVMKFKHTFEDCRLPVFAAAAFEVAIVVSSFLRGISYFTVGDFAQRSVAATDVGPWDMIWSTLFLVCLPIVFYGISRPNISVRVFGLFILGVALVMSSVAVILIHPLDGRSWASMAPGIACFVKVGFFMREYNFVKVTRRA